MNRMPMIVVDVEADGPIPGDFSMISFGAVVVEAPLDKTFYGQLKPVSEKWLPEALAVSGHTREETMSFGDPLDVMTSFEKWLKDIDPGRLVFITDNLAFDWQFINWYFHHFLGRNPFGYSGRRIGDLYSGLKKDLFAANNWKKLRETKHTHNPVDDAKGNAEALLKILSEFNK